MTTASANACGGTRPDGEKKKRSARMLVGPGDTGPRSGELHNYRIHGNTVARLDADSLDAAVALGAQDVLHLHRLDHGERLAGLDFLTRRDRDRDDQAGHRRAHRLAAVGELLHRHQPRIARLALGIDEGLHFDTAIGKPETVRDHAHMHGDAGAIDRAGPHQHAGRPVRAKDMAAAVFEQHRDRLASAGDIGVQDVGAEPDGAPALAGQRAVQLLGDAALALAQHVVDRRGDGGDGARYLTRRRRALEAAGKLLSDERGREPAGAPARVLHDRREKRNVVADAFDGEGIERIGLRVDRLLARLGVGDELGNHRIVVEGDFTALEHAGVVAHGHAVMLSFDGRAIAHQPADRGCEIAIRVLRVDAALDRPAVKLDVALLQGEPLAGGDPDHLLDEVDAGDEFGNRMFNLEPRIHLQEEETPVLPGDELDGAGAVVADGLGERDRLLAHLRARLGIEQRARRFLDDLLIAALDRAFALAEIDDIAVLVAENLDFDVARIGDELLDEHAVVAEARFRLGAGARKSFLEFGAAVGDAHTLAAAARRRLDHHRIADLVGDLFRLLVVLDHAEKAGNGRDLGGGGPALALDLVAHGGDRLRVRPDEDDAGFGERLGERRA